MNLKALHAQLTQLLAALDFGRIWPGFTPLRFALYDETRCCFDGQFVEKTDAFCANTSIVYQGEQIAIWMVQEETDPEILSAKLVHEMFHGYQHAMGWDCWPNEIEALYRYGYDAENLCLKLRENELLLTLLDRFDETALAELLAHRQRRSRRFPFEFSYESKAEEIEGTANYVEWQALKQLNPQKAVLLTEQMCRRITKPENLFPIRISCYDTGALLIDALRRAGRYDFSASERPVIFSVLNGIRPSDGCFPGREAKLRAVTDAVNRFSEETEAMIRAALERNEVLLRGPLELTGVNVYDARCRQDYLTSTYFLAYREDGEDKLLSGNFVIRMRDENTIDTVYRLAE